MNKQEKEMARLEKKRARVAKIYSYCILVVIAGLLAIGLYMRYRGH